MDKPLFIHVCICICICIYFVHVCIYINCIWCHCAKQKLKYKPTFFICKYKKNSLFINHPICCTFQDAVLGTTHTNYKEESQSITMYSITSFKIKYVNLMFSLSTKNNELTTFLFLAFSFWKVSSKVNLFAHGHLF